MEIKNTLCKNCKECNTLNYEKANKTGNMVKFKYCSGNKDIIERYRYGLTRNKKNPEVNITSSVKDVKAKEINNKLVNILNPDKDNPLIYLNKDTFDLRLKNLKIAKPVIYEHGKNVSFYQGIDGNTIDISKTMCKQCEECVVYIYQRVTKRNKEVKFKFCSGNKDFILQYDYTITKTCSNDYVIIASNKREGSYAEEVGRIAMSLYKKDQKNPIDYINGDTTDLRLQNMREITFRCLKQKFESSTSIFPGVRLREGIYYSYMYINGKMEVLGRFHTELDAYHAYVLKHEELGRALNKETRAHKKYLNEYDPSSFAEAKRKEKTSRFKGVFKNKQNKFISVGYFETKNNTHIAQFDNEIDAFHAHVLWCRENNKEVNTNDEEYQKFLKEKNPSNSLKTFISTRRAKTTSKFPNVYFSKNNNKWIGKIRRNKETVYYQSFNDEYEAHMAVEEKKKELRNIAKPST